MRRLFLYLIAAILVIGALRAIHHRSAHPHFGPPHPPPPPHHHRHREAIDAARKAADEARRALVDAGHEVREALREANDEVRNAYREARAEIRHAYQGRHDDLPLPPPPPEPPTAPRLENAEGLPVPIVPGTRLTDAEASPPQAIPTQFVSRPAAEGTTASSPTSTRQEVAGEICANEDRARADALRVLRFRVAEWLGPEIPSTWEPPAPLLESMIVATRIEPFVRDYGRLYTATFTVDFTPNHRRELIAAHERERVHDRLNILAGILAFILLGLAAISGYIRADEATKGYYTNHLRMLAAASVGAAGVVVYRMLA